MSKKQVHRPWLLKALMAGRVTNRQAAQALRLSVRQVQWLKGRYRAGGVEALQHGNRGRPSSRRLTATVRSRVPRLMTIEPHLPSMYGQTAARWPLVAG